MADPPGFPPPAAGSGLEPTGRSLDARYAPGEDVGPLLRAIAGGLAGGAMALVLDRAIPAPALATLDTGLRLAAPLPGGWLWPALLADAALGQPRQTAAGAAIALTAATLAALVYAYGQFRRFVPGPPGARGIAWALCVGLAAVPALVPRAAGWLAVGVGGIATGATGATSPAGWLVATASVWLKIGLGLVAYGWVLGVLNPPRAPAPPTAGQAEG